MGPVILIVDDAKTNHKILEVMLEDLGYRWEVASDGVEALNKFSPGHFALVLMDGQMPNLDGLQATLAIRAFETARSEYGRTPILATTANTSEEFLEECLESGMDDYLLKPFTLEQLDAKLKKWVRKV